MSRPAVLRKVPPPIPLAALRQAARDEDVDAGATVRMPPLARGSGLLTSSTAAAYDALAEAYDEDERREASSRPVDLGLLFAFAKLALPRAGEVADVGCGTGHAAALLGELGLAVHGLDVSARMVALARRNAPRAKVSLQAVEEVEVAPGQWAGALALGALWHAGPDDRAGVLDKLAGAIAPGGPLLYGWLTCGAGHPPGTSYPIEQWLGVAVSLEVELLSIKTAALELHRAGFDVISATQREALPHELPLRRGFLLAVRR